MSNFLLSSISRKRYKFFVFKLFGSPFTNLIKSSLGNSDKASIIKVLTSGCVSVALLIMDVKFFSNQASGFLAILYS